MSTFPHLCLLQTARLCRWLHHSPHASTVTFSCLGPCFQCYSCYCAVPSSGRQPGGAVCGAGRLSPHMRRPGAGLPAPPGAGGGGRQPAVLRPVLPAGGQVGWCRTGLAGFPCPISTQQLCALDHWLMSSPRTPRLSVSAALHTCGGRSPALGLHWLARACMLCCTR